MGPAPAARSVLMVKARIAVAIMAVSVIALFLLVFIWIQDRNARLDAAFQASIEDAQTAAEHAARTFETVEITLGMFARHMGNNLGPVGRLEVRPLELQGAIEDLQHVSAITVANPDGRIIFSSDDERVEARQASVERYLSHYRTTGSTILHVVPWQPNPDSDPAIEPITIAAGIEDSAGNFNGLMIAEVDPDFFRDFYELTIGGDRRFGAALLTNSFRVISNSSHFSETADDLLGETVSFGSPRAGRSVLPSVLVGESDMDSGYVGATVPIAGWPLLALVTYAPNEILKQSLGIRVGLAAAAVVVILAGLVAFLILSRNYGKQHRAFVQLEESRRELAHQVVELEDSQARLEKQGDQLKDMAEELILAKQSAEQGNRAKSNFLAQMSHELRTPLNAILGFSEIIRDQIFGADCPDRYVSYADDIHSSGRHLLDIINDILDLSKIEAGKMELIEEIVDISEVVEEVRRILAPRADDSGLGLVTDLPPTLPHMRADRRAVKQILINLLGNAIKYTPSGGSVTVSVAIAEGACRISVADTGIGISDEDMPNVLLPFGQVSAVDRSKGGTGLGVPIVSALARLHGGDLQVQSTPDIGSTFIVTLPRERILSLVGAA